jgi:hypothetical protein
MLLTRLFPALLLVPAMTMAQSQNALDFDGVNDQVVVSNAAGFITGATAYSMTLWVEPQNANPVFPNFDGFAGFRDDAGADFYITQVGPTTVEARFRNSVGTPFDISYTGVPLNTWSHLALVYDGSSMILYHNGAAVATVPASGTLAANAGSFLIGNSFYAPITNFWLDGRVDEVSLWNTALTAQQVDCIAQSGIDVSATGLYCYFKMDQGTAGGTNTSITTLTDLIGNANGTLSGLALTGSSSNFVGGAAVGLVLSESICPGESYTFNGQVLTQAGTYTASYSTGGSCDSVVTLVLSIPTVNVTVIQSGGNLVSQATNAQYQWLDCSNAYAEIAGATGPSYAYTAAGSYAVEVTQNGCTDTSACITVTTIGIREEALADLKVRYDAGQDAVMLTGGGSLSTGRAELLDAQGRTVRLVSIQQDRTMIATTGLPDGMYVLSISAREGRKAFRVVVAR